MTDRPLNATVASRQDLNARLAVVSIAPDGWELPAFEPGQYTTLGLTDPQHDGKLVARVFSIASAPGTGALEFYIQLVKEGTFTTLLWPHVVGDKLWLSPRVAGQFTLDGVPPGKDLVFVSTGTGLAPFMSMLRRYRGQGRWRRCLLAHGARTVDELGYRAELQDLARSDATFVYAPMLTREPERPGGWSGLRGRVQTLLADGLYERLAGSPLDPARCHVFLCGNPEMVDDFEQRLLPLGFTPHTAAKPGNIHFERYW